MARGDARFWRGISRVQRCGERREQDIDKQVAIAPKPLKWLRLRTGHHQTINIRLSQNEKLKQKAAEWLSAAKYYALRQKPL